MHPPLRPVLLFELHPAGLTPAPCRHTSIRTRRAFAAVPIGVLNSRGAAISVTTCPDPVAWSPTVCRDFAVTPTRRFSMPAEFHPVDLLMPPLSPWPWLWLPLWPWPPPPPCGCTAGRRPPRWPTTHATAPPVSAPPPPPCAAWRSCRPAQMADPQSRRSLSGAPFRKMQCAPCTSRLRSSPSPALVIPNSGWLLPLSRWLGCSPRNGPTSRLCPNRCASSRVST